MFKRIQYAEWHEILPILAFLISFLFFLLIVVRAVQMKKTKARELAELPLTSEKEKSDLPSHERENEK